MGVTVDDSEILMAVLNGLPDHFDSNIMSLDLIGEENIPLDLVKIRFLQHEKDSSMRTSGDKLALFHASRSTVARQNSKCSHFGRTGHRDERWQKNNLHLQQLSFRLCRQDMLPLLTH